eukprot:GDKJ01040833.1.p1 GENE.GDKJ01040833.1~~GDKJ01040833.1.p1  ORF type:complete len:441 (+),score=76.90 GDKJ01040833.1:160-1323(+)
MNQLLNNPVFLKDVLKSIPEFQALMSKNDLFKNLVDCFPEFMQSSGSRILESPLAIKEVFSSSEKGVELISEAMNANKNLLELFNVLEDPYLSAELSKICRSRIETGGDADLVVEPRVLGVMSALMQDAGLHKVIAATFSKKNSAQYEVLSGMAKGKKTHFGEDMTTKYGQQTVLTDDDTTGVLCCLGELNTLEKIFEPHTLHAVVQLEKATTLTAPPIDDPGKPTCSAQVKKAKQTVEDAIFSAASVICQQDQTSSSNNQPMSPGSNPNKQTSLSIGSPKMLSESGTSASIFQQLNDVLLHKSGAISGNPSFRMSSLDFSSVSAFIEAFRSEASFRYRSQLVALKGMGFVDGPHLVAALDSTGGSLNKTVALLLTAEKKKESKGLL